MIPLSEINHFSTRSSSEKMDNIHRFCINTMACLTMPEDEALTKRMVWDQVYDDFFSLFADPQLSAPHYQEAFLRNSPSVATFYPAYTQVLEWLKENLSEVSIAEKTQLLHLFILAHQFDKIERSPSTEIGHIFNGICFPILEKPSTTSDVVIQTFQIFIATQFIMHEGKILQRLASRKRGHDQISDGEVSDYQLEHLIETKCHNLCVAVEKGDLDAIRNILSHVSALQIVDKDEGRSLALACENKNREILKLFFSHPDLGAVFRMGALINALDHKKVKDVRVLISHFKFPTEILSQIFIMNLKDGKLAQTIWENPKTKIEIPDIYLNAEDRERLKEISKNPQQLIMDDKMIATDEMDDLVREFLGLDTQDRDDDIYITMGKTLTRSYLPLASTPSRTDATPAPSSVDECSSKMDEDFIEKENPSPQ